MSKTLNPSNVQGRGPRGLPPVILLGGGANALSVARCLGRRGIVVYVLNEPDEHVCYSRYATRIALPGDSEADRLNYLLGPESDGLRGAVLLSCDDPGIELLARHREALSERFLLDESDPEPQLCMLDKHATYLKAVEAGVPTPRFWVARSSEQVRALRDELVYPLLVKPFNSFLFQQRFGKKFKVVSDFEQLVDAYDTVAAAGIACMLVEQLQGPDDLCCSYYTYIDARGNCLYDFTKRVYRRIPTNMGKGTFHKTEWCPQVRDASLKLLAHVKLRGLACVEFRTDVKDGQLKLIEVNARFTAANALVAASGFDLASFVYNRLVGIPQPPLTTYDTDLSYIEPVDDFKAFLALRRAGLMTWREWLGSIARPHVLAYFAWDDPRPSLVRGAAEVADFARRRLSRVIAPSGARSASGPAPAPATSPT